MENQISQSKHFNLDFVLEPLDRAYERRFKSFQ